MRTTPYNAYSIMLASPNWPDNMQRAHRIQRNAALIEQLQLKQLVSDLASSIQSKPQKKPRKPAQPRRIAGKASCSDVLEPARRSARQKSMSSDDTDQQSLVKKQAIKDLEGILLPLYLSGACPAARTFHI